MTTRAFFDAVGHTLKVARFSVLMVAAGFVLLIVGPGQDLIRDVAEAPYWQRQWFFVPVLLWALSAWYWARIMLSFRFDEERADTAARAWCRRHLPRLLGSFAFVAVAVASWVASDSAGAERSSLRGITAIASVYTVVFYALVRYRRPIVAKLNEWLSKRGGFGEWIANTWFELPDAVEGQTYRALTGLQKNTRWVLGIGLAISLAFFVVAVIDPNWLGRTLGTAAVVYFLWAAICIPIGSVIVFFSNRRGIPGLTLLFLWALFCSYFNDNHAINTEQDFKRVGERPTVAKALESWIGGPQERGPRRPLIVVATAGGGSRAAYWTATVLGALEDKFPGFSDKVFAISGVSGGSVGAVVYKALHERRRANPGAALCRDRKDGGKSISKFAACGQLVLEKDFLAPTLTAMLYPDLVQRFWPGPIFNDRAHALERSMAHAWAGAVEQGEPAKGTFPFLDLWPNQNIKGQNSWPALFLNGTWVETGQRVITSNLYLERRDSLSSSAAGCGSGPGSGQAGKPPCSINRSFVRVQDLLQRIQTDVPVWTAANNSARFPLVEPVGTLHRWNDKQKKFVERLGHIADGGYFENYGAVTALEIVDEAVQVLTERGKPEDRFRIVVIQISSDPTVRSEGCLGVDDADALTMAPEIRGPIRTFLKTREARGLVAFGTLCDRVQRLGRQKKADDKNADRLTGLFVHFRMCPKDAGAEAAPPLSWMLSAQARNRIRRYLPKDLRPDGKGEESCNEKEYERLKRALDTPRKS